MLDNSSVQTLVSVVIPCYNHGNYLPDAIESLHRQTYRAIEIVVVDDGSTDNTMDAAAKYADVKYVYQKNQGLSSARNTGILNCTGELLVFLDADDLLLPYAIEYNVKFLQKNIQAAFVSGAHRVTTLDTSKIGEKKEIVTANHYMHFLRSNYIGMHATVMFRRYLFDEFLFDSTLKACEDYDMYLKVARKYPVAHHTKVLAIYRRHESNMSGNNELMLSTVLEVLHRQKQFLVSQAERKAYQDGIKNYKNYYTTLLFCQLRIGKKISKEAIATLENNNLTLYFRYITIQGIKKITKYLPAEKLTPHFARRLLFKLGIYKRYRPAIGHIKAGDFYRTTPFSKSFGYDRGGPIDRYYIENFLKDEADSIKGCVLEIGDNDYTRRFGKTNVKESEILHANGKNFGTIIGDLSNAPHIPDNSFDCIILTQTLHLVYDSKVVIQTCYRILKPGGSLLLTVPGITPMDYNERERTWLWSFTDRVIEKILAEEFSKNYIEINTFGNVYVASAFLYGMGLPELKKDMLDFHDPKMQVIITAKAIKMAV